MLVRNRGVLSSLLAGALVLGACDGSSGSLDPGGSTLTVQLTDAPGDLEEAQVKISKIILQGTSTGDSASARQEFPVTPADWIELTALSGGRLRELVSGAVVQPGTYSQLRLVVDDAYIVTRDGRVFATSGAQLPAGTVADGELACPSCAQSGFKVQFPGGIEVSGDTTTLLVDFDVSQSFGHEAGRSGKYVLRPVLIGTRRTTPLGSIGGTVTLAQGVTLPACGGVDVPDLTRFVPTATAGGTLRTGTTQADGTFSIASLPAETYALGVDRVGFANGDTLTFTATATPASVAVAAGTTATAHYSVASATCQRAD